MSHAPLLSNNVEKVMAAEATKAPTSTSGDLSRRELNEDGFVVLRGSVFG